MSQELKYGARVRITSGFYEGLVGKLVAHEQRDEPKPTTKGAYSFDTMTTVDYYQVRLDVDEANHFTRRFKRDQLEPES
jgi:hypothetical protein